MPCSDSQDYDRAMRADELDKLKKRLDHVTHLLCSLCRTLPAESLTEEVQQWWKQHQVDDLHRAKGLLIIKLRDKSEMQFAHDLLTAIVTGEAPGFDKFPPRAKLGMVAQLDVLCWVLEHDHNQNFGNNVKALREYLAKKGHFRTLNNPEGS